MDKLKARSFALIALTVAVIYETVKACRNIFARDVPFLGDVAAVIFFWMIPFLVAYLVERKDAKSLGLSLRRQNYLFSAGCAIACLVLPAFFVPLDQSLLIEFLEQIAYIGLAEEVYFRGYIMQRLCNWLGDWPGLLLNGLIFGLSHIVGLVSRFGFGALTENPYVGLYTALSGMVFGYLVLRTKSIVPSAIIHVGMNAYLPRLISF